MTDADGLPGVPPGGDAGSAATRIGDRDGGVSRRLLVRLRTGAAVLGLLGAAFLLIAAIRPWGMVSAGLVLVAASLLTASVLLALRARLWSVLADTTPPALAGAEAIIGAPRALSPGVPNAPVKRKLGAVVVPIHRFDGPQPGGGALIVHARTDAAALKADDEVQIWLVGSNGIRGEPATLPSEAGNAAVGGRFLIRRSHDGMIFLATSKVTDTW